MRDRRAQAAVATERAYAADARLQMSARVIAVANQKGGVGKTVTSINVAACLAAKGRRTLLIDLDPQGHCGVGLGVDIEALERTSHDLLCDKTVDPVSIMIQPVPELPTLSLIPANLTLALAERELNGRDGVSNLALATRLKELRPYYDEIVLDCPPALSKLSLNAFLACDLVIIPVGVGFFSIHGLRMLAETLRDIYEETGLDYDIRCLITRYRGGQTVSRDVRDAALEMFGDYCFKTIIRENVEVEKSIGAQCPLPIYAPTCAAAKDYANLVDELLGLRVDENIPLAGDDTTGILAPPLGHSADDESVEVPAEEGVTQHGH
jgi:chromosome partitioning protein